MNEENEKKYIEKLKMEFKQISALGYVKSVNNNSSGIGLTFEQLLGKKEDNFPIPDYYNIELKTKLAYSTKPISLFRLTPDGNDFFELKRLVKLYGYYSKSSSEYKSLSCDVSSTNKTKIGNNFYFQLYLNYENQKLELYIYNKFERLIDSQSYWTFDKIKNALFRKMKLFALIKSYDTTRNGEKYYKYYKMTLYKLKTFNDFIYALSIGAVTISFSVDIYKTGLKKGLPHDHGVCFNIFEKDLETIFQKN